MNEILHRIKRGELQLIIPIIEQYIDSIYWTACESYDHQKAAEMVVEVFIIFYNKIRTKYIWQNPEKFIVRSLIHSCRKMGFKWSPTLEYCSVEVPPTILRKVLINISQKNKRKSKLKLGLIGLVAICLLFGFGYNTREKIVENAEGTIYLDSMRPKIIHSINYRGNFTSMTKYLLGVYSLVDSGVLIDVCNNNNLHEYEIWRDGKLSKSFNIEGSYAFVVGNYQKDIYIFKSENSLYKYNSAGELLNTLVLPGRHYKSSLNNAFIAFQQDSNSYYIVDILEMSVIKHINGSIYSLNNNGQILYSDENGGNIPQIIDGNNQVIEASLISLEESVVVYRDGTVAKYKGDNEIWSKHLTLPEVNEKLIVNKAYILPGDNICVVVESDQGALFQLFTVGDGKELVDITESFHPGYVFPAPMLTVDQKSLLLGTQYDDGKKVFRYFGFLDISQQPVREIWLSNASQVKQWAIEGSDGQYFAYMFNLSSQLQVIKIALD